MATENAAASEVEAARSGGIDNHLLGSRGALDHFLAVIDKHLNLRVILKDEMGRLRRIQGDVRRVNDVHVGVEPVGRQFPVVQIRLRELVEGAVVE